MRTLLHKSGGLRCATGHPCHTKALPPHQEASVSGSQEREGTVKALYRGLELEVKRGARLRTALLQSGVSPHNGDARLINCRGLGTCGTCAVEISGPVTPATWTTQERLRLHFPPHKPPNNERLRLACQVKVQGNLHVTKYDQFWGQGSVPLCPLKRESLMGEKDDSLTQAKSADEMRDMQGKAQEPASRLGVGLTPLGRLEFVLDPDADKNT